MGEVSFIVHVCDVPCKFFRTHPHASQSNGLAPLYVRTVMYGKADWLRCISQSRIQSQMKNLHFSIRFAEQDNGPNIYILTQ